MMLLAPPPQVDLRDSVLCAWSAEHADALRTALAASDAHLRAWTPWVIDGRVPGLSIEERLTRHAVEFRNGTEWVYGLFTPDFRNVLGGCGLYARVGPGAVELGYWLAEGCTGRGLATRAAAALTRLAFQSHDVERVEIHCDPRNEASAAVPRRLAYRRTDLSAPHTRAGLMVWHCERAEFIAREFRAGRASGAG